MARKGWDGPTGLGTPNGERLWELVAPLHDAGSPQVDASVISPIDSGVGAPESGAGGDASAQLDADVGDDACSNCMGTPTSDTSNDTFPQSPPSGCACSSAPGAGEGNAGAVGAVAAALGALASRRRRVRA